MLSKVDHLIIATADCETDPFKAGRLPEPFCIGFYVPVLDHFVSFWGDDCVKQFAAFLIAEAAAGRQYLIYAHNGGRFDFHFWYAWMNNPITVINGRIVECRMVGGHVLRDSFSIIPVSLASYAKDKIDYAKMERHRRQRHRPEIIAYMKTDCVKLGDLVTAFCGRFGRQLTVGKTAITELMKHHKFRRLSARSDAFFREYYYGGRVQAFRVGVIPGPWKVYDMNSAYPKAMRDYWHPTGDQWDQTDELPDDFDDPAGFPFFIEFTGRNGGALPIKTPEGLSFEQERGRFKACSHELKVAMRWGLVEIEEIHRVIQPADAIKFEGFVDHFYAEKVEAKKKGDKIAELFAKFMLNSCYGKFGQSPDNFKDWHIERDPFKDRELEAQGYTLYSKNASFELWERPAANSFAAYFDVSIAASITSATRAMLLDGIMQAKDPIYCDTDSLICREFYGPKSETELGAWKLELEAENCAIGGKKLYTLFDNGRRRNVARKDGGQMVKVVTKGGQLRCSDVVAIAQGDTVEHVKEAPTFTLSPKSTKDRTAKERVFTARSFRRT